MLYQNGYSHGYAFVFMDASLAVFDLLEDRHAIKILIILLRNGEMSRTAIYTELGRGIVIGVKRLDSLMGAGFLEEYIQPVRPFAHLIRLSPKGEFAAKRLMEILESM